MPRACVTLVALALACARTEANPLAAYTGTWTITATNEAGDSTLVTYQLSATADTAAWTLTLPNRPPVPVRIVAVGGDSVVLEAGPYASVLREGATVSTHGVMRLQNGQIVGVSTAHYTGAGPDSVRNVRLSGTRTQ
jgi:predicted secreted hydrolase